MVVSLTEWDNKLIEQGSAFIPYIQAMLSDEVDAYGFHRWYGADPMWIKGKVPVSGASKYEKAGVRSGNITPAQRALLRKWRGRKPKAPFLPRPLGCYGWVWEVISTAYRLADEITDMKRFNTINYKSASDFLWLVQKQKEQGWKIIYFAADVTKVRSYESEIAKGPLRKRGISIDSSMLNFAETASPRDTTGLEKLKSIGLWWGTETWGTALGHHFFTGSNDIVIELNWKKDPCDREIIEESYQLERRLGKHGTGIVVVPPGTWSG